MPALRNTVLNNFSSAIAGHHRENSRLIFGVIDL